MFEQLASRVRIGLFLVLAVISSGCISAKSYVDSSLPKVSYESLQRTAPAPLVLKANFQRNGENKPNIDSFLQNKATLVLRASRMFTTVQAEPLANADMLALTVNNVADLGAAAAKGFGTGLTFGLAGSLVTDGYEIKAEFTPYGGRQVAKNYTHAIHTTVGNKSGPEGLTPMSPAEAFDKMLEEVLLKLLFDLKAEGSL